MTPIKAICTKWLPIFLLLTRICHQVNKWGAPRRVRFRIIRVAREGPALSRTKWSSRRGCSDSAKRVLARVPSRPLHTMVLRELAAIRNRQRNTRLKTMGSLDRCSREERWAPALEVSILSRLRRLPSLMPRMLVASAKKVEETPLESRLTRRVSPPWGRTVSSLSKLSWACIRDTKANTVSAEIPKSCVRDRAWGLKIILIIQAKLLPITSTVWWKRLWLR